MSGGEAVLVEDPHGCEDAEDYTRRQALGLRPIFVPDDGPHPDPVPCPSWCWRAGEPHGAHGPVPMRPTWAWHTSPTLSLAWEAAEGVVVDDGVVMSTIDLRLQTWSDRQPAIQLKPHHPTGGSNNQPAMVLTLDDARELAHTLLHLLDQATGTAEEGPTTR